jgi:hypothetical protein
VSKVLQRDLQTSENKIKLSGIDPQMLISFEMGNRDATLICTYGKITFICQQNISDYTIGLILKNISAVDNSTSHEMDIVCDFDDIQKYQRMGYTLVTYGRYDNKYRVTFNIPFSSDKALYNLTIAFSNELKLEKGIRKDFYWNGKDHDIIRLLNELKSIDGWETKSVKNKEA